MRAAILFLLGKTMFFDLLKNDPVTELCRRVWLSSQPRPIVEEVASQIAAPRDRLRFFMDVCDHAFKKGGQPFGKVFNLVCAYLISRGDIEAAHTIAFRYDALDLAVVSLNRSQVMFRRGDVDAAISHARDIEVNSSWSASVVSSLLMTYHDWGHLDGIIGAIQKHTGKSAFEEISNKFHILANNSGIHEENSDFPIYCINLDRDEHRFLGLKNLYERIGCSVLRQPGALGSAVPQLMRSALFRSDLPPNSIGCWSSQVRTLERIVESGHECGLIIEDDGLPAFGFGVSDLLEAAPQGFDICFLNDRAVPGWWSESRHTPRMIDVNERYDSIASSVRAIGADGYLVSKRGAERILDDLARNGAVKHYDWQIYSYGIESVDADDDRHVSKIIKSIRRSSKTDLKLNCYVSTIPYVVHSPMGFNARVHFNNS